MSFQIRMGVPDMEEFWNYLVEKHDENKLKGDEKVIFKKLVKSLKFLQMDPRHPGLHTHEIEQLSKRYGIKVWQ